MEKTDSLITMFSETVAVEITLETLIPKDSEVDEGVTEETGFFDKTDSLITKFSEAVAVGTASGTLIPPKPKDSEEVTEETGFWKKLIH